MEQRSGLLCSELRRSLALVVVAVVDGDEEDVDLPGCPFPVGADDR